MLQSGRQAFLTTAAASIGWQSQCGTALCSGQMHLMHATPPTASTLLAQSAMAGATTRWQIAPMLSGSFWMQPERTPP